MRILLASSLGGCAKVNGTRVPEPLPQKNGFLARLKAMWPENARVLFICADPAGHRKNDDIRGCFRVSLPMSGLGVSSVDMCGGRTTLYGEAYRILDGRETQLCQDGGSLVL